MQENKRPKIGFALSGAAARSVFYIGFLEEMKAQGIPVDVIAAQSGATIVASSFACGTLETLKKDLIPADTQRLKKLVMVRSKQGGGFYSLDAVEEYARDSWTLGKTFDEVMPRLCFLGADLHNGQLVPLAMGDIARAVRISCTVPGLFEPVQWGNRLLVDGGLLNYIPGDLARDAGVDIVVGVSVRATRHIFLRHQLHLKDWYNKLKLAMFRKPKDILWSLAGKVVRTDRFAEYVQDVEAIETTWGAKPGLFTVIGRALDLAIEAAKHTNSLPDPNFGCDILVQQGIGTWGGSTNMDNAVALYKEGVAAGKKYGPHIKKYIENYQQTTTHEQLRFVTN
jgi:predicted acylesterase/phospholipase RssA